MSNNLDPLPADITDHITCHYVNATGKLQIIRIENIPNWYFERIIFPGQTIIFHTVCTALLEVHTCDMATAILADRIPCSQITCKGSASPTPISQKKHKYPLKAA